MVRELKALYQKILIVWSTLDAVEKTMPTERGHMQSVWTGLGLTCAVVVGSAAVVLGGTEDVILGTEVVVLGTAEVKNAAGCVVAGEGVDLSAAGRVEAATGIVDSWSKINPQALADVRVLQCISMPAVRANSNVVLSDNRVQCLSRGCILPCSLTVEVACQLCCANCTKDKSRPFDIQNAPVLGLRDDFSSVR